MVNDQKTLDDNPELPNPQLPKEVAYAREKGISVKKRCPNPHLNKDKIHCDNIELKGTRV